MASRAGDIAGSTASGAATGTAIMPGWGTAIGGVIGAIGGYFGSISARKKEREQERLEERIMNMLSIKKFNKFYARYLPIIRSQIAATVEPALKQQVAGQISERGLSGTGLGEVLRSLSTVAGGIEAQNQAGGMARQTQIDKARALGAQISRRQDVPARSNPLLDALLGAAQGGFSGFELDEAARGGLSMKRRPAPLFPGSTREDYESLP